jgi:hypothetical protein
MVPLIENLTQNQFKGDFVAKRMKVLKAAVKYIFIGLFDGTDLRTNRTVIVKYAFMNLLLSINSRREASECNVSLKRAQTDSK